MKVLLTNPPWIFNQYMFCGKRTGVRAGSRWPFSIRGGKLDYIPYPGFLGYAASYLLSQGIDAVFYDAIASGHGYREFFSNVEYYKPDIVIQEVSTPSIDIDLWIAKELHKKKIEVCLVGPHATAAAPILAGFDFVDYVLKGAYEFSALEVCKYRRRGLYDYNVADIKDLPYPWRDKAIIDHYRDTNCLKSLKFPQLWVYSSRGCVFSCDFCLWAHSMFNKRFSLRDAGDVLKEIEEMAARYNFKHIYFDDDCWNIGPAGRLRAMAEGLKRIGLPWTINARLDLSSNDDFSYFVDNGCVGLRLGIESLSQRLLDCANKGLTVGAIVDKIKYLESLDVELYLLFMHYLPGENNRDRAIQDVYIRELGFRHQNPPCIPFPGTPYYEKLKCYCPGLADKISPKEFDGGNIGNKLIQLVKKYSAKL